jgi:SAM-dependent methyltransferase
MTYPVTDERNAAQIEYWNGPGGQRWLARQEAQDALLTSVTDVLADRAAPRPGEIVLDIGCGCGATSLLLAQRVAPGGQVLGVDVSAPLLERARQRAPSGLPLSFVLADATVFQFEPGRANLLCSRFGVMFFADPIRSFANMRTGLRSGGRLAFACWREPRENPWLLLPLQEAYRHVPRLPEVGPEEPGPFSFADPRRVRSVLQRAGFVAVELESIDLSFDLAGGQGLGAAVDTALNIGPTSRALDGQPVALWTAAAESIRTALAAYQVGDAVRLPGALWLVTATNP